jgi:hypothetical protein
MHENEPVAAAVAERSLAQLEPACQPSIAGLLGAIWGIVRIFLSVPIMVLVMIECGSRPVLALGR